MLSSVKPDRAAAICQLWIFGDLQCFRRMRVRPYAEKHANSWKAPNILLDKDIISDMIFSYAVFSQYF